MPRREVHERQRVKRPFHKVHAAIHVAAGGMEHAPPVGEG